VATLRILIDQFVGNWRMCRKKMSKREGGPHGDIQTGEGVCLRNELGISWLGLGPNFERSDRAHLASSTLHSFSPFVI
jgi:hypothetical protein